MTKRGTKPEAGPEEQMRRKSSVGTCCGGGCVTIVLLVLVVWLHNSAPPVVKVPPRVLPSPNAFDTFITATKQLVDDKKISAALSPSKKDVPVSLEEKRKLVEENRQALATFRQGLNYEYMDVSPRSLFTQFPYLAGYRNLARVLSLESSINAEEHKPAAAVNSALDAMHLGVKVPRGTILIGELVGIACEAIGRKPLQKAVDQLSASEAKAAVNRLEKILSEKTTFADTLTEEKYMTINGLVEIFRDERNAGSLFGQTGVQDSSTMMMRAYLLLHSKQSVINNYAAYMDENIKMHKDAFPGPCGEMKPPKDPFLSIICPVFSQADFKDQETRAFDGLLLMQLALHAYNLDHHAYPASLNELVGPYVKQVPADPFALHGTLLYINKGATYVLYSVGPDGKDDRGKAIDDPSKIKDGIDRLRYYVDGQSKGDIVAGINVQ